MCGLASSTPAHFAEIKTPTALIWGARDAVTPLAQGERLHRLLQGSTLETIPEVGHIPHIEDEQAFLSLLKSRLAFLTQPRGVSCATPGRHAQ